MSIRRIFFITVLRFSLVCRSNEVCMNFLDGDAALVSARDCLGNTFEIKQTGRHAFYDNDTYDTKECSQCKRSKGNYEREMFGERCMVVSRDYSGER
jgi:hypothetical protein